MPMSDLTILISTRNRPDRLAKSITETRRRGVDARILVYDDASDDPEALAEKVRQLAACELIRGRVRCGPAAGRNFLAKMAGTKYLLFLDDDTYPESEESVGAALDFLERTEDHDAVVFRMVRVYDGVSSCPPSLPPRSVSTLIGGASLVRAEAFLRIGGYRAELTFGAEDTELAWRMTASGHRIWCDPRWVVLHDHVRSGRDLNWEQRQYARGRVLAWALNLRWPIGLLSGLAWSVRYWFRSSRKLSYCRGILGGVVDAVRLRSEVTPIPREMWRTIRRLRRQ